MKEQIRSSLSLQSPSGVCSWQNIMQPAGKEECLLGLPAPTSGSVCRRVDVELRERPLIRNTSLLGVDFLTY